MNVDALFELAPDAVFAVKADGTIEDANPPACTLLAVDLEQSIVRIIRLARGCR